MKISQIYIYPIKSLRGAPVSSAQATRTGFKYDRRFMLLQVVPSESPSEGKSSPGKEPETTLKNMHVVRYPEMGLFTTEVFEPDQSNNFQGRIRVTYRAPAPEQSPEQAPQDGAGENGGGRGREERVMDIPLTPSTRGLEELAIMMHRSPTKGYNMGQKYNRWFSECFGYDVVLAYLGDGNSRRVLGSFPPSKHFAHQSRTRMHSLMNLGVGLVGSLLIFFLGRSLENEAVTTVVSLFEGVLPRDVLEILWTMVVTALGGILLTFSVQRFLRFRKEQITFADTAPYLVISETSVADVSGRLEGDEEMDVRKFRANIVVAGVERAFEEDYWAELVLSPKSSQGQASQNDGGAGEKVRLLMTANCVRCRSLDVDFATGKMGTGESGKVLKKLSSDRRVDKGAKYSPVFGRYGFLDAQSDVRTVRVGDEVVVARKMEERSVFGTAPISRKCGRLRVTDLLLYRLAWTGLTSPSKLYFMILCSEYGCLRVTSRSGALE